MTPHWRRRTRTFDDGGRVPSRSHRAGGRRRDFEPGTRLHGVVGRELDDVHPRTGGGRGLDVADVGVDAPDVHPTTAPTADVFRRGIEFLVDNADVRLEYHNVDGGRVTNVRHTHVSSGDPKNLT